MADATIGFGNTHAISVKKSAPGMAGTDLSVGLLEAPATVDVSVNLAYAVLDSPV